ncbi:UvrD-helicase domain-containing protein [Candidatus Nitrosacidococcus sp. I8]|uniref:UvrD-helicase domain-containing protein n=1 Tax=Candidatus Nitrosacidococcus sp. I8 TaxID=2942908 RepID=UPI002228031C|nr:UvrD-helicase domain-containing protein [Candidatus Nitrosacidococcus sp. I8]CAH9018557.1 ATP-dependent helicase/nuclease subunit A [Candidatus Nitrosacidococcus sp. I8]
MIAQNISDSKIRKQALDSSRSFIVQAPAGSGKTELLTQRYLNLLAKVNSPEEIVAITFTRKAAAEMQARIIEALMMVEDNQPTIEPKKTTWALAKAVLGHDQKQGWDLLQYPNRLRIQTIDSLCAGLTQQMPWLSRFGTQPKITDRAKSLYQQAAHHTLMLLEHGNDQQSAKIVRFLHHLNNRWNNIEELLVEMLKHRDQWLRHFTATGEQLNRDTLEKTLQAIISKALLQVNSYFSKEILTKLLESAHFASCYIERQDSPIRSFQNFTPPLKTNTVSLTHWQGIVELLLIEKGEWRKDKGINKKIGFPPEYKDEKAAFINLLNEIQSLKESEALRDQLHQLRSLPTSHYEDDQWEIIQVLSEILLLAVAQLQLVFQLQGSVDFTEVSQRASQALEETNEVPTDLALILDHKISHLLVDEFQDTSLSQYLLLKKLTYGWEREDGRTLFIVGDPMQSIYSFREANVGLFLYSWHHGLGDIALTPLKLEINFRSQQAIVDWVNLGFSQIFPKQENISLGGVPYSFSKLFHSLNQQQTTGVHVHPFFENNRKKEAIKVIELIQQTKEQNPRGIIALLVRSRSHLIEIIPYLKNENLSFQALEIDLLKDEEVVQDLLALTKALFHPADRISWFSILRAPWCGLTLHDLYQLADLESEKTIWECIQQNKHTLSQEGKQQLVKIERVFTAAFKLRRHRSPRQLVESTWLALGGPACITEEPQLESAKIYLDFLETYSQDGNIFDFQALEDNIQELYAPPDSSGELQIMTIHKAKGLEFDTVIIPGLGYAGKVSSPKLLMWAEYSNSDTHERIENSQLLLAPIKETGGEYHSIYQYLNKISKEKEDLEKQRLLYVAATRAKQTLHLLGHINYDPEKGEIKDPQAGSLLSTLWPLVKEKFEAKIAEIKNDTLISITEEERKNTVDSHLYKLDSRWQQPSLPDDIYISYKNEIEFTDSNSENPIFDWAGNWARYIGIVVHRYLQIIAQDGIEYWNLQKIAQLEPNFRQTLLKQGLVDQKQLDDSLQKIQNIFTRIFEDNSKGKWILSSRHQQAHNEYPLSGTVDQDPTRIVIDRTFVDENGYRWIIDYKTSTHDGGNLDEFLDHEQERYRSQLEHYASLMTMRDPDRQIYLGLYYPALSGWRQWRWQNNK